MSRRHARAVPSPAHRQPGRSTPASGVTPVQQAWGLYSKGERAQAESLCRSILAQRADDTGAMTLLGIMLAQSNRLTEAAELLEGVARRTPQDASAHNNHGNVLRSLGRYGQALACYDRAISILPDHAEAHYNRGVTLHDLRHYVQALASYDRALELQPDHASAWNNRGATLRALERKDEALASYDRALRIRPDYAEAHNNRGVCQQELGDPDEALASYDRALALRPHYAEAHSNRGSVLQKRLRFEEALASYDRALTCQPGHPEAHNGRGVALIGLEQLEDAVASFDSAIAARPAYAEAYSNRGAALRMLKRYPEALASCQRAVEVDPRCIDGYTNLGAIFIDLKSFNDALACFERALAIRQDLSGYISQGAVLQELKRSEEAVASYQRALSIDPDAALLIGTLRHLQMQMCDWADYDSDVARIVEGIDGGRPMARPFNVLSLLDSPALQRKASDLAVPELCTPRRRLPPMARNPRHERIRLGYFSADLYSHAVTVLTAELFETHDRSRFELTAFSLAANVHDDTRSRIEPAFDRFLWVGAQSDWEIAELSRRLGIDIAIDLGGYTGDSRPRIMALRAAPIQVSYLGYLGTMGGDFMDYLIADPVIVPPEAREHYAEKLAYLPSYQVNDTKRVIAEKVFTREELGLPPSGFVFCCFNASYKITPEVFASWMRILAAVPDSVLFLVAGNALAERNLRREAAARGISPQRLVFGARVAAAEYLARYRAADLFLDTSPYNAGTTASDALWVGLPVVSCMGESFAARVAASVLTAAGLPELITHDRSQYERLAIELATQPESLAAIRRKMAERRPSCALFDTPRMTRNLEELYTRMYERHLAGLPADHLPPRCG